MREFLTTRLPKLEVVIIGLLRMRLWITELSKMKLAMMALLRMKDDVPVGRILSSEVS